MPLARFLGLSSILWAFWLLQVVWWRTAQSDSHSNLWLDLKYACPLGVTVLLVSSFFLCGTQINKPSIKDWHPSLTEGHACCMESAKSIEAPECRGAFGFHRHNRYECVSRLDNRTLNSRHWRLGTDTKVATLGSCEFMEVADGESCKKPDKPQSLAFYMYKAKSQQLTLCTRFTRPEKTDSSRFTRPEKTFTRGKVWWVSGWPCSQAAGPNYPMSFNETGSMGSSPELSPKKSADTVDDDTK